MIKGTIWQHETWTVHHKRTSHPFIQLFVRWQWNGKRLATKHFITKGCVKYFTNPTKIHCLSLQRPRNSVFHQTKKKSKRLSPLQVWYGNRTFTPENYCLFPHTSFFSGTNKRKVPEITIHSHAKETKFIERISKTKKNIASAHNLENKGAHKIAWRESLRYFLFERRNWLDSKRITEKKFSTEREMFTLSLNQPLLNRHELNLDVWCAFCKVRQDKISRSESWSFYQMP